MYDWQCSHSARACIGQILLFFPLLLDRNKIYLLTLHEFHVKGCLFTLSLPLQMFQNQELSSNRCQNVSVLFIVKTHAKTIFFLPHAFFLFREISSVPAVTFVGTTSVFNYNIVTTAMCFYRNGSSCACKREN